MHTEKKDGAAGILRKGSHLQAEERSLRRNQTFQHLDFQPLELGENKVLLFEAVNLWHFVSTSKLIEAV